MFLIFVWTRYDLIHRSLCKLSILAEFVSLPLKPLLHQSSLSAFSLLVTQYRFRELVTEMVILNVLLTIWFSLLFVYRLGTSHLALILFRLRWEFTNQIILWCLKEVLDVVDVLVEILMFLFRLNVDVDHASHIQVYFTHDFSFLHGQDILFDFIS